MQALTIQEPWASLLIKGKKKFETRNWQRNYRGLLAIHSGKRSVHPFDYPLGLSEILDDLEITQDNLNNNKQKIIAIATLKEIHLMTDKFINEQTQIERLTGFWQPGGYAWELTDIQPVSEPILVRGMPGLWEVSDKIQQQISQQVNLNFAPAFKCW